MASRAARASAAALLAAVIASACGASGPSHDPTFGIPLPKTAEPATPSPAAASAPASQTVAPFDPTPPPLPSAASWARLAASGTAPAPREDHTWTLDPNGRTAYLFGGRDGATVFDDLWAFDLAALTWREIEIQGPRPPGRFGHEAVWAPVRGGLLVTFGQAGGRFFNDLWLFEPSTSSWRELPAAGSVPVPRYGSCSGIGPDGRLWISHGFTEEGTRFSDTRAYDLEAQAWTDETPPGGLPVERCLHACWWSIDGSFTLYGGQTTGVAALGDLWSFVPGSGASDSAWLRLAGPDAAARQLPAVARRGPVTYLVGGRDVDRKPLGDAWLVPDVGSGAFSRLRTAGAALPPRSGAAMVYDEAGDRMLVFGGLGAAALDDLWELTFD